MDKLKQYIYMHISLVAWLRPDFLLRTLHRVLEESLLVIFFFLLLPLLINDHWSRLVTLPWQITTVCQPLTGFLPRSTLPNKQYHKNSPGAAVYNQLKVGNLSWFLLMVVIYIWKIKNKQCSTMLTTVKHPLFFNNNLKMSRNWGDQRLECLEGNVHFIYFCRLV